MAETGAFFSETKVTDAISARVAKSKGPSNAKMFVDEHEDFRELTHKSTKGITRNRD